MNWEIWIKECRKSCYDVWENDVDRLMSFDVSIVSIVLLGDNGDEWNINYDNQSCNRADGKRNRQAVN